MPEPSIVVLCPGLFPEPGGAERPYLDRFVACLLAQTWRDFTLYLGVLPGEPVPEALASAPFDVVPVEKRPEAGVAGWRNDLLAAVPDERDDAVVLWLDLDDWWPPEYVEAVRSTYASRPDAEITVAASFSVQARRNRNDVVRRPARNATLITSGTTFRRRVAAETGGFDEAVTKSEMRHFVAQAGRRRIVALGGRGTGPQVYYDMSREATLSVPDRARSQRRPHPFVPHGVLVGVAAGQDALVEGEGRRRVAYRREAGEERAAPGAEATGSTDAARLVAWEVPTGEVVIVSGLPRSGTSMMMQMLAAGGTPVYTDHKRGTHEVNPRGFFEHDRIRHTGRDASWLIEAEGKAAKVVSTTLPALPKGPRYKVIVMHRDPDEVAVSMNDYRRRMHGREGGDTRTLHAYHIWKTQEWCQLVGAERLDVQYADVIADPRGVAKRVKAFLGRSRFDVTAAAAAVDPALYRNRKPAEA